ncbi:hypothetical protein FA95DRAFT_481655 [Auriscalpium vulgare]|uniref:Uncharacterized protein n=1 Tax=Auriscalpium vulgare TaxID=40419 RepID=A0ACB8SAW6_9AGAM|nr:hypothetical protein FA95DRAFT_481655 [Auriscalpium vulgare]
MPDAYQVADRPQIAMGNAPSVQQRVYGQGQPHMALRASAKANQPAELLEHTKQRDLKFKTAVDTKLLDRLKDEIEPEAAREVIKACASASALPHKTDEVAPATPNTVAALAAIPPAALPKTYADATNLAAQFPTLASDILKSPLASGPPEGFRSASCGHTRDIPNWALAPPDEQRAAPPRSNRSKRPGIPARRPGAPTTDENAPPQRDAPPHLREMTSRGEGQTETISGRGRNRRRRPVKAEVKPAETKPSRGRDPARADTPQVDGNGGRSKSKSRRRARSKARSKGPASASSSAANLGDLVGPPPVPSAQAVEAIDEDIEMMEQQLSVSVREVEQALKLELPTEGDIDAPEDVGPVRSGTMLASYACYSQGPRRFFSKEQGLTAPQPTSSESTPRLETKEYFERRTRERSSDAARQPKPRQDPGRPPLAKDAAVSQPKMEALESMLKTHTAEAMQSRLPEGKSKQLEHRANGDAETPNSSTSTQTQVGTGRASDPSTDAFSFDPNGSPFTPTATSSPRVDAFGLNSVPTPPAGSQALRTAGAGALVTSTNEGEKRALGPGREAPHAHRVVSLSIPASRGRDARELAFAYAQAQAQRAAQEAGAMQADEESSGGAGGLSGGVALGCNPATRGRARAQSRRASGAYARPVEHVVYSPSGGLAAPQNGRRKERRKGIQGQGDAIGGSGPAGGAQGQQGGWNGGWGAREELRDVGWDWANADINATVGLGLDVWG